MPEAAEVTVASRQLAHVSVGRPLSALPVTHPRTMRATTRAELDRFVGRSVRSVEPVGKWIVVRVAGEPASLGIHLRMSGQLLARHPDDQPADRHVHARLDLGKRTTAATPIDGAPAPPESAPGVDVAPVSVWFRDPRTFGEMRVLDTVPGMEDIRDPRVTPSLLEERARRRSIAVKPVLLDQARFVAGIGSYLADEILHVVGLDPRAPANALASSAWARVIDEARHQIDVSARAGGVTLADEGWVDLWARPGRHGDTVLVHGRAHCGTCGGPTSSAVLGGRSARWCRRCQHPRRRR